MVNSLPASYIGVLKWGLFDAVPPLDQLRNCFHLKFRIKSVRLLRHRSPVKVRITRDSFKLSVG